MSNTMTKKNPPVPQRECMQNQTFTIAQAAVSWGWGKVHLDAVGCVALQRNNWNTTQHNRTLNASVWPFSIFPLPAGGHKHTHTRARTYLCGSRNPLRLDVNCPSLESSPLENQAQQQRTHQPGRTHAALWQAQSVY